MKKLRICLILCSIFLMFVAACGKTEQNEMPGSTPTTVTPVPTEEPTKMPEMTSTLEPTETPVPTEVPLQDITYTFKDLKYVTSYGVEYSVKEDGSLDLQFAGQWQEIKFQFPEEVDMTNCTEVTVKAKSEYGNISFKLFGENFLNDPYCAEEYIYAECKGTGSKDYKMTPFVQGNLYGFGIMAMETPEDASAYTATVESITFHMDEKSDGPAVADTDMGDIVYTLGDAEVIRANNASAQAAEDGSLKLQFDKQWGMVRLRLPEGIDLSECMYVSVEMNTYGNNMYLSFFDENILKDKYVDEVEVRYTCNQDGTMGYHLFPTTGKTVYAIGVGAGSEVTNPESYVASLYSVTFYMLSGNKVEVPVEVAPNVTEDMTLLNTYGAAFGKVGTAVSLGDLQSVAYLETIKSQYNSVTSGWQAKMDQVIVSNPTLISVEKAKSMGYVIPDNYKEAVVPKFDFGVIDETMKICAENGLYYRVHTLIWHQQALDWFFRTDYAYGADFVSPEVMDARMEMYIRTVMEHICTSPYIDIVYAWDVVNEYIHFDNVNYKNYTAIYGPINREPKFVKLAFTIADDMLKKHGLQDQISLFYNDYNTYVPDEWGKNNTQEIISLINFINSDGKVCDGVGMQTHLMMEHFPDWRDTFKQSLQAFLDAGLEVQLTEIDVYRNVPEVTEEVQAEAYVALLTDVLELKRAGGNITGITFWGMADQGLVPKPYLFEQPGRPKEVYYRVLQAYQEVVQGLTPAPKPTNAPKATATPVPTATPISTPTPDDSYVGDWNIAYTFDVEELQKVAGGDVTLSIDYDSVSLGYDYPVIQLTDLSNWTNLTPEDIVNGVKPDAEWGDIATEAGKTNLSLLVAKETIERLIANGGDQSGAALAIRVNGVIIKNASLTEVKQDRIVLDASYPEANEDGVVCSASISAEILEQYDGPVALTLSYVKTGAMDWPWYIVNTLGGSELFPKGNTSIQTDSGTMTFVLEKEDVARAVAEGGIWFHLCEVYFTQAIIRDAMPEDYYVGDYNVAYTFVPDELKNLNGDVTFTMEYTALPGYRWPSFQLTELTDTRWIDLDRNDYVDGSKVDDYECIYVEPDQSKITMVIKEDVMQNIISAGSDLGVRVVGIMPVNVSLKGSKAPAATPVPTATPTPVPTKAPNANNELTFTFDEMKLLMEHNLSYEVEADGSLKMKINAQYGGIKFALPQGVNLADCESVTVKMKSEYSSVAPQLCEKDVLSDPWLPEKYITFGCQGDGIREYELYQEGSGEIWAIGFMGTENVEDFSKYEVEVYSITFHMKPGVEAAKTDNKKEYP